MGWRFRKSFKVIPGLRLNLSKSGLSASIGGAPLTLNIGPHGLMGTASIPGTGISLREHFGTPAPQPVSLPAPEPMPSTLPYSPVPVLPSHSPVTPVEQIRSASTELLTSETLKEVKKLLQTTFEEREDISSQLDTARTAKHRAVERYESWEQGFVFKHLFKKSFANRKAQAETDTARVSELEEQLRLTTVAAQIDISKEQAEPYFQMRDAFASLCECAAIWDIKTRRATDRYWERTTATSSVDRERVSFSLASSDLIQWEQKAPHLSNANGGDLFLYPGFILYRAARGAFSVIDYHELNALLTLAQFQEAESVPKDAKVIGHTWAKANKDGSPDRRFSQNYQIPVVAYAQLSLKTESGLWEEYHFSDVARVERFVTSLGKFTESFQTALALPASKPN